jgi:hypothetical protein
MHGISHMAKAGFIKGGGVADNGLDVSKAGEPDEKQNKMSLHYPMHQRCYVHTIMHRT